MSHVSLLNPLIMIFFLLWGWSGPAAADTGAPPPATMPYDTFRLDGRESGFVLLPMRINGRLPVTMLVDTGTTDGIISAAVVRKLGLTPKPFLTPDGRPVTLLGDPTAFVDIAALSASKLTLNGPFVVSDRVSFIPGHPIDGIIGMRFLAAVGLIIDYPRHEMTVTLPSALTAEGLTGLGFAGAASVPITRGDYDCYYTTVLFHNGAAQGQERMMIDSASNDTIVSAHLAYKLGLKPDKHLRPRATFSGGNVLLSARVQSLQMGEVSRPDHAVSFPMLDMSGDGPKLGTEAWINARVLFDFPGGRMYLQGAREAPATGDATARPQAPKT